VPAAGPLAIETGMRTNHLGRSHAALLAALVLGPLAAGAVVVASLAAVEHGGPLWWTFALAAAGTLAFLGSAARGRYARAGLLLLAVAAVVSGWVVWHSSTTGIGTLLGAGAPAELAAVTWLLVVPVTVLAAATALWRKEIIGQLRAVDARSWCALLAIAVLVAGVVGTGAWLGGRGLVSLREHAIEAGAVEHTVDSSAAAEGRPRADTVTGPRRWRMLWRRPAAYYRTVVATPSAPLVVSASGSGEERGVAVHDARTGAERWHFRTRFFDGDDAVAVSPSIGRLLVIVGSTAIVLDLDTGTELDRFPLPPPTAGPTLGETRYRIIGPQRHDPSTFQNQPQVEAAGIVVHLAVIGLPGPSDVLTVSLRDGRVATLAKGLPENCRFRVFRQAEYVDDYDYVTWLLRDGAGCGTPTLTSMWAGRVQTETPVAEGCVPQGCELPEAYAARGRLVIQTGTTLLTFDARGTVRSRLAIEPDGRSVILPDDVAPTPLPPGVLPRTNAVFAREGATIFYYRATSDESGRLVGMDTATGREISHSDPMDCAKPASMSLAADVLIVTCGSAVLAFG
jgi:hypothetical protein